MFFVFLFFLVIFLFLSLIFPKDKRILFLVMSEDSAHIVNFNFLQNELFIIDIPKNTQVNVSYNLGQWELGSVWKLGEQEGIGGGTLVASTIRKNFFVPVYLWIFSKDKIFVERGPLHKLLYFVFPRDSNIGLLLRLRLALVSAFGRMSFERVSLSDTSVLEDTVLKTGQVGFLIRSGLPSDILHYFREPLFEDKEVFVSIVNESGNLVVVDEMGKVIDTIGARLISVENRDVSDFDCLVYSQDEKIASIFFLTFGCRKEKKIPFNLEDKEVTIKIGKKFVSRW